ncbi:MAG: class I SAM-dependent methyltransferase, partial [Actinobacteria bacterium]|nr:class I SAM-dependent methyltransferase [Actinomycetota bacterium]
MIERALKPEPRHRPNFSDFTTGLHYHRELESGPLPDRLRLVTENLGPPGRVLDVGCHTGFLCRELQRRGWDAEGLESNEDAAAVARSNDVGVVVGNVEDAATWAGVATDFDAILLLDILEHTYDPWAVL